MSRGYYEAAVYRRVLAYGGPNWTRDGAGQGLWPVYVEVRHREGTWQVAVGNGPVMAEVATYTRRASAFSHAEVYQLLLVEPQSNPTTNPDQFREKE